METTGHTEYTETAEGKKAEKGGGWNARNRETT